MRLPIGITIIAALVGMLVVFGVGMIVLQPPTDLILAAQFEQATITPNADGDDDITFFTYDLARNATISIVLEGADERVYRFREDEPRIGQDYRVAFSGVVDGYTLPDEQFPDDVQIERRLIPDGRYTWRFIAETADEREERTGTLTITDADAPLPLLTTFTIGTDVFTPNQDGVDDRVFINVYLEKAADLRVFLLDEQGIEQPIAQRREGSREGEAGRYTFDYDGGVDLGQDPPPDGTYNVIAVAQDAEGQRVRRVRDLTIALGGKPRAEISPQFVDTEVLYTVGEYQPRYASDLATTGATIPLPDLPDELDVRLVTVPLGEMLVFRLTVHNYSDVPIRTTGPAPGTVYEYDQIASSLGALEEPGAWRVGIQCDASLQSFPWRWAIGTDDNLITIADEDTGREFQYLPPQTFSVVWGAIRMNEIPVENPQTCWAGLIHEGVAVSLQNAFVDPREIQVADTRSETE
jgi:hypothetical protein